MLDKCLRGNRIAPLQHAYLSSLGTCAKGVQFYCPSHTYRAIHYCSIFSIFSSLSDDETDSGDFQILPGLISQKNLKNLISETVKLCNSVSLTTEVKINNQYKKNMTKIQENSTTKILILHLIKAQFKIFS